MDDGPSPATGPIREYINYRALKRLANAKDSEYSEEAQRAEFLFMLENELQKVEGFYVKRLSVIERRLKMIRSHMSMSVGDGGFVDTEGIRGLRLFTSASDLQIPEIISEPEPSHQIGAGNHLPEVDSATLLLEHVEECRIWILKLTQYASLNAEGFRKALKKYDKKHNFTTNLLEQFNPKLSRTQVFRSRHTLETAMSFIDECAKRISDSLLHGAERSSERGTENAALAEIRRVWNEIYSLQAKSILETDQADQLDKIMNAINLGSLITPPDQDQDEQQSPRPSRAISLLEREHLLLLKYLLDGISFHLAINCLALLIDSGLSIPSVEDRLDISLIIKVLTSLLAARTTATAVASEQKSLQMVQLLVKHGASISAVDSKGRTCLHLAAMSGSLACLELLLGLGGEHSHEVFDYEGCSPLFYAVQLNHPQLCTALMDRHDQLGQEYCLFAADFSVRDQHPLIVSSKLGHLETLRAMLARPRIDPNFQDEDGETGLYHCAKKNFVACLSLFLERGADSNLAEKYDQWTPLFVAAANGYQEVVEALLRAGAEVERVDCVGWTPFEHAIFRGHLQLATTIRPNHIPSSPKPKRPVGSEVTTEMIPQEFGHACLGTQKTLRITLGHRFGPRSQRPAVDILNKLVMGPLDLQLQISASNAALAEPKLLELPLSGDVPALTFLLENDRHTFFCPWDEIRFDLVRVQIDGKVQIVGRGSLVLRFFLDEEGRPSAKSTEQYVVPILHRERLEPMAIVSFEVLLACPFLHACLPEKRHKMYWKSVATKVIGHRGLGANAGLPHPQIGENTVLSFVMAASLGAEYVEFDVQVTKDKVPVLYHDFLVKETGLDIAISSLTLQQFLDLKKSYKATDMRYSSVDDEFFYRRTNQSMAIHSPIRHGLFHTPKQPMAVIDSPFATLKEAFRRVPPGIGFNVEVKYPTIDEFVQHQMQYLPEINDFCDQILSVVFEEAGERPVLFSSFHPDICLLLSLKQPTYPVFFLTEGGVSKLPSEPRANSLKEAVRFANESHLLGIVCHSTPLVEAPRLIRTVQENGLLLFTYGPKNNDVQTVRLQTDYGVDAVIVDSVARIRKGLSSGQ